MEHKNTNTNNNTHVNNIILPSTPVEKKNPFIKSAGGIITSVIATLLAAIIMAKAGGIFGTKPLSAEERNKKIVEVLERYSKDVNGKTFDAYKYFAPKIERFYQMFDTSPAKINSYVNSLFYKQFQNPNMRFDQTTMNVTEINNNEFDVSIIMYSDYFNAKEKKQYINYKSRTELKIDTDFHIRYFRQFYN